MSGRDSTQRIAHTFFELAANPQIFHAAILIFPSLLGGNSIFAGSALFVGWPLGAKSDSDLPTSSPLAAFAFLDFDPDGSAPSTSSALRLEDESFVVVGRRVDFFSSSPFSSNSSPGGDTGESRFSSTSAFRFEDVERFGGIPVWI